MCGINGIFAYGDSAPPVDEAEMVRTREHMAKRGPDGAGLWISPSRRVGLAHRRLAIIDLSETGAQPMATADGRLTITYNGEIYNYRALRRELEAKGFDFRSQSDTEVLLHLYAERGAEMVHALRGMFAFGIWDARERSLFLARDPFGIKPLYYSQANGTLRFASQVKALLAGGAIDPAPEPAGSAGFLLWGCVPEPFTLYRDIKALPAGTTLTAVAGSVRDPAVYFSVREELVRGQATARQYRSEDRAALGEALLDTVRHHMVSDVPVGVFLSAGVDSTLVTSLAARQEGAALRTLTLGFREYRGRPDDEVPVAERTAAEHRTRHETHWISSADFGRELEPILQAMDQPTTDGVNTYFVCRAAARAGIKVALSGLGGDELFGGYPSFTDVPRLARWLPSGSFAQRLGQFLRKGLHPLLKSVTSPKYAGLLEYGGSTEGAYLLRRALFMPWELSEVLDPDTVRVGLDRLQTLSRLAESVHGIKEDYARVAALEMSWYMRNQLLRDADWAGMAHSLEVRVPFVDPVLFRRLAPWIASSGAPQKADAGGTPIALLPDYVTRRPKTGFTVPVREWTAGNRSARTESIRGLRGWALEVQDAARGAGAAGGAHVRAHASPSGSAERILIFRIGQLGDTVVSVPAFWAVRRRFPAARITLLCDRQPDSRFVIAADLLRGTSLVDEFKTYAADLAGSGGWRRSGSMLLLLAWLRSRRFDKLIYLAPSGRTEAQILRDHRFFAVAGIREFIGMQGSFRSGETPGELAMAQTVHEADRLLARLAADGIPTPPSGEGCMDLQLGAREALAVRQWLAACPPDGARRWLGVGPGSKMPAKRWPIERYEEVVSQLIARHDVWPVVFGGPEDRLLGDELLSRWGRGYNAAGPLHLRAAAAALARCAFFLGNDTGTMHLAAAVGTPSVAVFSARDYPGRWHPYGRGHIVLRTEIDCAHCGLVECVARKNECLTRISAATVLHECEKMIAGLPANIAARVAAV